MAKQKVYPRLSGLWFIRLLFPDRSESEISDRKRIDLLMI